MLRAKKRIILSTFTFGLLILLTLLIVTNLKAANNLGFRWHKSDTLDDLLSLVGNKAGDDEIFVSWDLAQYGDYKLHYNLDDNRETIVNINHQADQITINYGIFNDTDGTPLTEEEINKSFQEMDYDALVPEWKTTSKSVEADGTISYTIKKGASSQYSGVAFRINNVDVRIKWNIQTDELYFLTKGVDNGKIVPFNLEAPSGENATLNVLRAFEDFLLSPTHWVNVDANNEDLSSIEVPSTDLLYQNETPGGRPGIRITFKQPMIYNQSTHQYEISNDELDDVEAIIELSEISGSAYTDFKVKLNASEDNYINPPNTDLDLDKNINAEYKYDDTTNTYTIEIVKDKSSLLNQEVDFLQWNKLEPSRIYSSSMVLSDETDFEFGNYEPSNKYGYTYLDYQVERANIENAYLDIHPYAGSDEDELEYTVHYSKSEKTTYGDDDIWLKHYHSSNNNDTNIYIPVPFREGSNQEFYQLGVSFAGRPLRSQIIKYIPINDTDIPPPTPRIEGLNNLVVVPSLEEDKDPEKVQFNLEWDAPMNTMSDPLLIDMLDNGGKIYYELLINKQPSNTSDYYFNPIKVFEVSLIDDEVSITELDTGKKVGTPVNNSTFTNGYSQGEQRFSMKNIILKDSEGWGLIPDITEDIPNKTYEANEGIDEYNFEFPGVYFLRMRAVYVSPVTYGHSDLSVPTSVSLDTIRYNVPIPTELDYSAINTNDLSEVKLKWDSIDISEYENYMLTPLDKETDTIKYNWFLSTEKSALDNIDKDDAIYLDTDSQSTIVPEEDLINLREGKVICSEIETDPTRVGEIDAFVQNLDPNHTYYVRVNATLNIRNPLGDIEQKESEYSDVITVVTPITPEDPGDDLILPLAPEDLDVAFMEDSNVETMVNWTYPKELSFEEGKQGFEIVVLRDQKLPEDLQNAQLNIDDIIKGLEHIGESKTVYRLYKDENETYKMEEYNESTESFEECEQILEIIDNEIKVKDIGLISNTIFYYHVRTFNINEDDKVASKWIIDTITTNPIAPPENLVVPTSPQYNYDEKTQTIIRFDAPIPFEEADSSNYSIEVFVKGEEDKEYTQSKYSARYLDKIDEANDGYTRMFYRVSDLKPGKSYNIKVRIEDRTKQPDISPDGENIYPKSNFSKHVETRTDFDQIDYDKEEKFKQYILYYESKVEELKDEDFWIIEEESGLSIKYREDKLLGKNTTLDEYQLYTENNDSLTYYLSSNTWEFINDKGVNLLIESGLESIGIRPNTIGVNLSNKMKEVTEEIQQHGTNYKDFYVIIEINKNPNATKISGLEPIGNYVDIQFKLKQSRVIEQKIETEILNALDRAIENRKITLINMLEDELETGIDEERLSIIVNEVIEQVEEELQGYTKGYMDSYLVKDNDEVVIDNIHKPINIGWEIENKNASILAYYKEGSKWKNIGMSYDLSKYFINGEKLGRYTLVLMEDFTGIYDEEITTIVNEFDLSDIFTSQEIKNPNYEPNKSQLISTVARVLGAPKNVNSTEWLKEKGIDVNLLNNERPISKENAYYIMLRAFEEQKGINLNKVTIQNYNIIRDIDLIDESNQQIILAGLHLNLFELEDGHFYSNQNIKVKELLSFLKKLQDN